MGEGYKEQHVSPERVGLFQMAKEYESESPLANPEQETDRIVGRIEEVVTTLGKEKAIIALSGGLDSTVVLDLAIRALGKENVIGLYMPNEFTLDETHRTLEIIKETYDIPIKTINLDELSYQIPGYEVSADYAKNKLAESYKKETVEKTKSNWVKYLDGEYDKYAENMRYLFASTSMRAALLQLESLCNNAVMLTAPNKTEKETGLYVDGGPDCNGDMQPIVHLYKMQVFQLGKYLGIPKEILERVPTGDMKSLPDEESLGAPYALVDLILLAHTVFRLNEKEIITSLTDEFRRFAPQLTELGYTNPETVVKNVVDSYELSRNKAKKPFMAKN